jgi:hypothetical protein
VAWSLTTVEEYPTQVGPLPIERYQTADLASGQPAAVQLAGDVVLAATGVELHALDTPPKLPSGEIEVMRVRCAPESPTPTPPCARRSAAHHFRPSRLGQIRLTCAHLPALRRPRQYILNSACQ